MRLSSVGRARPPQQRADRAVQNATPYARQTRRIQQGRRPWWREFGSGGGDGYQRGVVVLVLVLVLGGLVSACARACVRTRGPRGSS